MRISFDFDATLSRTHVQKFAQKMIDDGHDVWVTTTRLSPPNAPNDDWNDDLFEVTDKLGISRDKIRFTNKGDKYPYFKNQYFVWHLDDMSYDVKMITKHTKTIGISCFGNTTWMNKCEKLLK